ncbi:MAG: formylglycine-generating enzyme family protein [Gemmataceae bacterium]
MAALDTLLAAIAADPADDFAWLALADCLEEQGRDREAELTRLREWLRGATPRARGRRERERRLQELLAEGVIPVVPQLDVEVADGVAMSFCLIPPGWFLMGSPREPNRYGNEGPRHVVRLTRGFWLGRTPVTVRQWHALAGGSNYRRRSQNPATGLSWDQLRDACRGLRRRTGRPFRLPTEAEWEYACRAGTRTPFHSGSTEDDAHRAGWHKVGTAQPRRHVGTKEPNAWGLYDLHGGVWEWCLDGRRVYGSGEVTDPAHELHERTVRVLRGGSFDNRFHDARAACRGWANHDESARHWGARLAISREDDDPVLRAFHGD